MNLNLDNKNYIVSGSSRGIGLAIARILLQEGAQVMITGRNKEDVASVVNNFSNRFPGKVYGQAGDLNDPKVLSQLKVFVATKWKILHGIIANAGAVKKVQNWDVPESDWEWFYSVNFKVTVNFVTNFIPNLKEATGAAIVVISSIAGVEEVGAPIPYSTAKAAINMYAKGLSKRLAPFGIRVNTVAPGNVIFPGGNWDKKLITNPDGIKKMLEEKVPLNQFGSPDDIGNITAFLMSEKSKFITGSCLIVDGGQTSIV